MSAIMIRPTTLKIDPDTRKREQRLADVRQRSAHWLMLEAFRQDGIKAWNEYQATGLHLTMEEADAWLSQLESGIDAEPPGCHV
jgi:predicted transcriptional regulator